jgi:hypothetical protein
MKESGMWFVKKLSSTVLALQVWSPEFKPQCHQIINTINKAEYEAWGETAEVECAALNNVPWWLERLLKRWCVLVIGGKYEELNQYIVVVS